MIHDTNFVDSSPSIDLLIDWLKKEKEGGATYVTIMVSPLEEANDSELVDSGEYAEEEDGPKTIKLSCE